MVQLECEACGRRTVSLEGNGSARCAHCGYRATVWSPIPLSIAVGGEPYEESEVQRSAPREDQFRVDASELL